jgi:geranylgeranyl diphosphate synthase type II
VTAEKELRALVESYLAELALTPELGGLEESMRHALAGGGKRVRPVLCLATAEAAGADPEAALPAGAALELVHNFSLVHDDLPALDDDELRRGRKSTWAAYGEAVAVLAGDALLAEALRLALSYPSPAVARELVQATLGMIGGQYLDITSGGGEDLATLHRLKTGCLFSASVACALWVAEVPEPQQKPWRAFADEVGLLFQIVDDILDEDGYVLEYGADGARGLADEAAERARAALAGVDADTSVLEGIVDELAVRTS